MGLELNGSQGSNSSSGYGPPTRDELREHYPAKFSWFQLKLFVNSGDLGLLKRDKTLQKRYDSWAEDIEKQYGSIVNYLVNYRLQWGKPDNLSLLASDIEDSQVYNTPDINERAGPPPYFRARSTPRSLISIIQNDWPYSVPLEVEHTLIWTRIPILPSPHLIPEDVAHGLPEALRKRITDRLNQDGIWGFTGSLEAPPDPSLLPHSLGALSEWDISMDKVIRTQRGSEDEEAIIKLAGGEMHQYVKARWNEEEWETAWFVNPPRLQSVKGLAHAHVFAKRKCT